MMIMPKKFHPLTCSRSWDIMVSVWSIYGHWFILKIWLIWSQPFNLIRSFIKSLQIASPVMFWFIERREKNSKGDLNRRIKLCNCRMLEILPHVIISFTAKNEYVTIILERQIQWMHGPSHPTHCSMPCIT